jgi:hypothetical protein
VSVAGQTKKGKSVAQMLIGRRTGIRLRAGVSLNGKYQQNKKNQNREHEQGKAAGRVSGYSGSRHELG